MGMKIKITLEGKVVLRGELFDNRAAEAIKKCLPFEITFDRWGEELYGVLNKELEDFEDKEQEEMDVGDLALHKQTKWFCIFWGRTPASTTDKPKAAVPVCKVGRIDGDWKEVEKLNPPVRGIVEADNP